MAAKRSGKPLEFPGGLTQLQVKQARLLCSNEDNISPTSGVLQPFDTWRRKSTSLKFLSTQR